VSLHCPPCADWRWFGSLDPQRIAALGIRQSEPSTWIKHAYAWLWERLDKSARADLPSPIASASGPPECLVPVLAVSADGRGYLGFVYVAVKNHEKLVAGTDAEHSMQQAAETVTAYFRRLLPDVGFPHVAACLPASAAGASGDLSVVIATLAVLLHGHGAQDIVATGCVKEGSDRGSGGDLDTRQDCVGSALGVSAVAGRRRSARHSSRCGNRNLSSATVSGPRTLYDRKNGNRWTVGRIHGSVAGCLRSSCRPRNASRSRPAVTLATTRDFLQPLWPPLVRHVAHDIRSRALLHAGQTELANFEKERAAECRPDALDMPDGWLGDYLKWQQPAHRSVVALDQARWDDDDPDHVLLDRTLERLLGAIKDRQAGRTELVAALFLSNTRARRYDFLARRRQDIGLLERAWDDLIRFSPQWPQLFAYLERSECATALCGVSTTTASNCSVPIRLSADEFRSPGLPPSKRHGPTNQMPLSAEIPTMSCTT
jgi:hypothetical protein